MYYNIQELKNMKYISNAFSPKMLKSNTKQRIKIEPSSYREIQEEKLELVSAIGHQQIANILGIEKNRINIQLEKNDILYVVQGYGNSINQYEYQKIIIN